MSIALLFPGQTSQVPGMLNNLPDHPEIVRTLDEANEVLAANIRELDSEQALQSTSAVQLALLICGVAMARVLRKERVRLDAVAGLSVGAFAAAVQCGVISLSDAIRLVQQRSEMMIELFPKGYGLAVIVGLSENQVSGLVEKSYTEQTPVYVGNINAPRQIVISGSDEGMAKVLAGARESGARKAERLHVSVPSHCPVLEPVAEALRATLKAMHVQQPRMIYIGNVSARPLRTATDIAEDLAGNIPHGVRWHDMTTVLEELGCRLFLEMPPGHVLSELGREAFPGVRTLATGESSLRHVLQIANQYSTK